LEGGSLKPDATAPKYSAALYDSQANPPSTINERNKMKYVVKIDYVDPNTNEPGSFEVEVEAPSKKFAEEAALEKARALMKYPEAVTNWMVK